MSIRRRSAGDQARQTSLVAMTHASNVLGTVQPIEAIAAIVREAGALFLVDAAQSAGVVPIDLRATRDRPAGIPRSQGALRPDRHRGPLRRPAHRRPDSTLREGGTGGDSSSPTQPTQFHTARRGNTQRPGRRRTGRGRRLGRRARAGQPAPT